MLGAVVMKANQLIAEVIDIARDVACVCVVGGCGEFAGTVSTWVRADEPAAHLTDGKRTVLPD
jgi:hypothetical protein